MTASISRNLRRHNEATRIPQGSVMKTFLVGGAVRDELLGRSIVERDWVVVGETPDSMLERGFRQVGKDFPVFLHPKTQEEYALARREYKQAPGHQGFRFDTDPDITLEEDLTRRDLTINAIAKAPDGTLIDPCGGQKDLAAGLLRHVSEAFTEDPLRVLRLAQFQARLADLGFRIHDDTTQLCRAMVKRGDLKTLSRERVFKEFEKALRASQPSAFFGVLESFNALALIFPGIQLAATKSLDEPSPDPSPEGRFSQLVLENPTLNLQDLNAQVSIPKHWMDLAALTRALAETFCQVAELSAETILAALERGDARRKPARFEQSVLISSTTLVKNAAEQAQILSLWRRIVPETAKVTLPETAAGLSGQDIKALIRAGQLRRIKAVHGQS